MTRLPAERVRIGKGAHHPVDLGGTVCANPWCGNDATDIHHIVRRSELIGAYDAVEIDGELVPNVCGLCRKCHNDVTENRVRLVYDSRLGFIWQDPGKPPAVLAPHPHVVRLNASPALSSTEPETPSPSLGRGSVEADTHRGPGKPGSLPGRSASTDPGSAVSGVADLGVTSSAERSSGEGNAGLAPPSSTPVSRAPNQAEPGTTSGASPLTSRDTPVGVGSVTEDTSAAQSAGVASTGTTCPTCNRKLPKPKQDDLEPLPARKKQTWAVRVPKDTEDGAEIIETLLQAAAEELGRAEHASWRYFTLVEALHFFVTTPKEREAA